MDKDRIEVSAYLARQDFSEKEVENLHAGKEIIREGEPEE